MICFALISQLVVILLVSVSGQTNLELRSGCGCFDVNSEIPSSETFAIEVECGMQTGVTDKVNKSESNKKTL